MKKERNLSREREIKARYAFLIKGKDDALKSLIHIGKKWGAFRYVMLAFLFVFLFVYHVSYNFLIQCKVHEKFARVIACSMVVVLVFTSIRLTAFATGTDPYAVQQAAVSGGYETLTINPSSLNGNAVWGLGESYTSSVKLDQHAAFYAYSSSRNSGSGGFPTNGSITIGSVPYQLGWTGSKAYDGNDCIRLYGTGGQYTTMNLNTYGAYDDIYVLGTAGGPGTGNYAKFTVTLIYTDGSQVGTTYKMYDWYDTTSVTNVTKQGGWYRYEGSAGYTGSASTPVLQSAKIDADSTKLLKAIQFSLEGCYTSGDSKKSDSVYCGVFAVTGKVSESAPATPALHEVTDADITSKSFVARWDGISNATKYYLDVATDASFANMISGYNNKDVGNVTEFKVDGLTEGTTYYYRVRSANNSGQSLSSTVRTVVPRFKNIPGPVLSYENTVVVGEETYLQTVSWPGFEAAGNYRWSVEVTDENETVSTYSGDLSQTAADSSVYVVTDGSKYWLNITDLVDSIGSYKVSVIADPVENSDEYISSNTVFETVNIVYPDVTVDVTDELKASGIVSGIGGDCEKSVTDGVITLTAKNANAYSELGTWYKSGEVFDTGISTSLTANIEYVDNYVLIFDINRNKLELVEDENGNYSLKLLEDIELEQDLVFGEDIILDLNEKNITTNTNAALAVDDVILNIRNGHLDSTDGSKNNINTIANGVVIVENSVVMSGDVGGTAEVSWKESNGDTHYATINGALTGGGRKEAEDNSILNLIKDKELTEDITIPETITIHIPNGKELSVAENVTLTNEGSIVTDGEISNAGTIINSEDANWQNDGVVSNTTTGEIYNEGSLDNTSGQIDNAGLFEGEGRIENENGVITSTEGILHNQISNGSNGKIVSEASWNEDGKKYYGPIDEAFESATNNTDEEVTITVEKNISIDEDVTIPENVTLKIPANKTLTVPEGVVLDNNGEIVEAGTLQVNGDLKTNASWTDGQTNHYADLNTALDKVEAGENITILEDITWDEDATLEIPQDVDLVVPNDVVFEIDEEKLVNPENIKSEASWKGDDFPNNVSFGALKEALEDSASNSESNVDILIRDEVVVEEDLVIPENAIVKIPEDAALTIPEGVVVQNNGSVEVDGEFNPEGTFNTEATWQEGTTDFYGTLKEAIDVVNKEDSDVTDITIVGDVTLKEDITIPEGTNITINEGANLTVPDGKELENNGNITNNGTLTNNGTISNNKEIINDGLVEGDGSIANSDSSRIETNEGIIKNKITDELGVEDDSKVESEAVITDPVTGEKYFGSLDDVLENAEAGDQVKLNKDEVVLGKDTVIPEDVTLIIPEDATLTVPEGTTLKNNGSIVNDSESGIVINEGTAINNGIISGEGTIVNNEGSLDLTEGITNNAVECTPTSILKSEAVWEIDGELYRGSLEKALEAVANNGGGSVIIDTPKLNIEDSIIIPEGVELVVPDDTVVTIKDGAIVENNGKITSSGEIKTEGTGKIDTDASWSDLQGKTNYGSIEELLEEMTPDENGASNVTEVTITGDNVELPSDIEEIIIPEGVKLEIAEDASLILPEDTALVNKGELVVNGEINGDGSIDNSVGTIEMGNGAIKSEIAEGKEGSLKDLVLVEAEGESYYCSLEEALNKSNVDKVTIVGDVTLKGNVEIPEGVTLIVPEDATLTIPEDATLTVYEGATLKNNGSIVNDSESGIVINEGTAINNGFISGDGAIVNNDGYLDLMEGITSNQVESTQNAIVKSEAAWEIDGTVYHSSLENALEAVLNNGGGSVIIDVPELNIEDSITIPEGIELVVPEDTVVTIKDGAIVENNGKIVSEGEIKTEGTGKIDTDASWLDAQGKINYGSIEDLLEEMAPDENGVSGVTDATIMGEDVTLPADGAEIVIPEGVKLEIAEDASLKIPEGVEVILSEDVVIENKGTIENSGHIDCSEGFIGGNPLENTETGTPDDLVILKKDDQTIYYTTFENALEEAEEGESIIFVKDTVLSEDVEIPENVTLEISENVELTIPEDVVLKNNGTIDNKGSISNAGVIDNMSGTAIGGEIDGEGQINAEAVWTKNGENYYGSIEEGIEDVETSGGTIALHNENVVVDRNITIPSGVTLEIPEGTKMTVSQNGSLVNDGTLKNDGEITNNGNIAGDGTINNDNGTINSANGVVSNVIENGENGKVVAEASWEVDGVTFYGSLEEAIESTQAQGSGTIVINNNIVITSDIAIPEGVTLEIKQGVTVKVAEGVTLTNEGTIVNKGTIGAAGGFVNNGNVQGGGAVVDLTQQNKPSSNKPSEDTSSDDKTSEDKPLANKPSESKPTDDGADSGNEDVAEEIIPQEPEENTDVETEESVKGVIEESIVSDEEQAEIETRIKVVDEAKKETQITSIDVNFEEAKAVNVAQDTNVSYGQGEVTIILDTLDKQGSFNKVMYDSVIISEVETVINACLSKEEKAKVENGAAAEIRLIIQVSPQKVSTEDKTKVEETVLQMQEENAGLSIAGYLDISVEKSIEGQQWKKISKLGEEIVIKFEVPTEMQVENAKYCVLRLHNGETALLEDLDDEENTITIRTRLFSTYSILYENAETGFNYIPIIVIILIIVVLIAVWLERNRRKKIKEINS